MPVPRSARGVIWLMIPLPAAQLGADLFRESVGEVALVGGTAVHVAEPAIGRDGGIDRIPERFGGGRLRKTKLHRAGCGGSDSEQQIVLRRITGADQQSR